MNETTINLKAVTATPEEIADLEKRLKEVDGLLESELISTNSFNGLQDVILLLTAAGGGVVIAEVARTIRAWIAKDAAKSVQVGDIKVEGFGASEALTIIKDSTIQKEKISRAEK